MTALAWARERATDLWLGGCALLFGLFSLSYPLGHDQGLYYYVGREWLLHGRLPYRDALEQKTPGIFLVNGVLAALLPRQLWAVRGADLLCVLLLGRLAAWAVTPPGSRPRPGQTGFACLAASVFLYGFFLFWDTSQCELYMATAAVGSFAVARHARREGAAVALAGLIGGIAILFKPTGAWFALVALGAAVARAVRSGRAPGDIAGRVARSVAVYAAAAAAVPGAVLVYFWARGALPALVDVLVGANGHYFRHDRGASSASEVLAQTRTYFLWFRPLSTIAALAVVVALLRARLARDASWLSRLALPGVYALVAYASVVVQLKFYRYHWEAFVAPCAVLAAAAYEPLAACIGGGDRRAAPAIAAATMALYLCSEHAGRIWLSGTADAFRLATGLMTREEFHYHFAVDTLRLDYHYRDSELAGRWLREHSAPDDDVLVRGFYTEVYAVADRSYHGRFFWTNFLTDPKRAYRREEWLAEDRAAILASPPRFVVTATAAQDGVDSLAWIRSLGLPYETRVTFGTLQIAELAVTPPVSP